MFTLQARTLRSKRKQPGLVPGLSYDTNTNNNNNKITNKKNGAGERRVTVFPYTDWAQLPAAVRERSPRSSPEPLFGEERRPDTKERRKSSLCTDLPAGQ